MFLLYLFQFFAALGGSLVSFALPLSVYSETGSISELGVVYLCIFIPRIIAPYLMGILIDKWPLKYFLCLINFFDCLIVTILGFFLYFLEGFPVLFYALIFIQSILTVGQQLGLQVSISFYFKKSTFFQANSLINLLEISATSIAPLFATLILSFNMEYVLFSSAFVLFISSLIALCFPYQGRSQKEKETPLRPIKTIWEYVYKHKYLIQLVAITCILNFLIAIGFLLFNPLILKYGTLSTVAVVSSITAFLQVFVSLVGSGFSTTKQRKLIYLMGLGIFSCGFAFLILGSTHQLIFWMISIPLASGAMTIFNIANRSLWQMKVEKEYQGRIFGLRRSCTHLMTPLGFLLGMFLQESILPIWKPGSALEHVQIPFLGAGILLVCLGTYTIFIFPRCLSLEHLEENQGLV